jgi:disease resistance protein RPM1
MVQVSTSCKKFGTMRRCHIHDLLLELAISEAKEENFSHVNPQQNEENHCASRRAAYFHRDVVMCCTNNSKLRSLLFFDVFKPNQTSFRLLRVLELYCVKTIKDFPVQVTTMIFLRYLGLRSCSMRSLPKTIDHLQDLQTLDIRFSALTSVPVTLWNIKTLRHVRASSHKPINGPPKGAKLEHLQTLRQVKLMAWEESLPCVQNIRKLGLSNKDNHESKSAIKLLKHLEHLCSLVLEWQILPEEIVDMRSFISYKHIQSVQLRGKWPGSMTLDAAMLPVHITKLGLFDTWFEHDPMIELCKLQNLKVLYLGINTISCNKTVCLAGGFLQLQWLFLVDNDSLEEFCVEKGSLPVLKNLIIQECSKLKMLPDLQYVTPLQELVLTSMPEKFVSRTAQAHGKDWHKIKHVHSIKINWTCQ